MKKDFLRKVAAVALCFSMVMSTACSKKEDSKETDRNDEDIVETNGNVNPDDDVEFIEDDITELTPENGEFNVSDYVIDRYDEFQEQGKDYHFPRVICEGNDIDMVNEANESMLEVWDWDSTDFYVYHFEKNGEEYMSVVVKFIASTLTEEYTMVTIHLYDGNVMDSYSMVSLSGLNPDEFTDISIEATSTVLNSLSSEDLPVVIDGSINPEWQATQADQDMAEYFVSNALSEELNGPGRAMFLDGNGTVCIYNTMLAYDGQVGHVAVYTVPGGEAPAGAIAFE